MAGSKDLSSEAPESFLDTVIVGGGPAGLSAALVLGRCRRRVVLFDSGRYRNHNSSALHCYLGNDGVVPHDFRSACRAQLERYSTVEIISDTVTGALPLRDGFRIETPRGTWLSAKLLIASGVEDTIPEIAGIEDFFGSSVHVCPYCDGWEHRDAAVAVYGAGEKGAEIALMLRRWTQDLLLCTDGCSPSLETRRSLVEHGIVIEDRRVLALEGQNGILDPVLRERQDHQASRAIPRDRPVPPIATSR